MKALIKWADRKGYVIPAATAGIAKKNQRKFVEAYNSHGGTDHQKLTYAHSFITNPPPYAK